MRVTYYSRKRKSGKKTWYYRIVDDGGERSSGINTHCTSKKAAQDHVNAQITNLGSAFWKQKSKTHQTFKEYAKDWWLWDRCPYSQGKRIWNKRISRSYCDIRRGYLERHILPTFGPKRVSSIKPIHVERWLLDLPNKKGRYGKPLSPITCNQILSTFRIMFNYGVSMGILESDPTKGIEALGEEKKEKGLLELGEIQTLFDETQMGRIWLGDEQHYTLNLVAAGTGMRLGELQGLQRRFVPLPNKAYMHLQRIMEFSPYRAPNDFVFHGDEAHPINHRWIAGKFYGALRKIGISEEQRKERNITRTAGHSRRLVVSTGMGGYKAWNSGRLTTVLIEAVMDMKTENNLLRERIANI